MGIQIIIIMTKKVLFSLVLLLLCPCSTFFTATYTLASSSTTAADQSTDWEYVGIIPGYKCEDSKTYYYSLKLYAKVVGKNRFFGVQYKDYEIGVVVSNFNYSALDGEPDCWKRYPFQALSGGEIFYVVLA